MTIFLLFNNLNFNILILDIDNNGIPNSDGSADIIHLAKELGKCHVPAEEAAKIAAAKLSERQSHNTGWYRIQATRRLTGGQRLVPRVKESFKEVL